MRTWSAIDRVPSYRAIIADYGLLAPLPLPQRFVSCHGDAVRQIETADLGCGGNAQLCVGVLLRADRRAGRPTRCRRPARRPARYVGVEIRALGLLGEEPMSAGRQCGCERVPIVDDLPREMLPIVEPGAAEVVIVDAKPQRPHQPQLGPDGHARAADAARVVGDLRLVQHDVQPRFVDARTRSWQACRP